MLRITVVSRAQPPSQQGGPKHMDNVVNGWMAFSTDRIPPFPLTVTFIHWQQRPTCSSRAEVRYLAQECCDMQSAAWGTRDRNQGSEPGIGTRDLPVAGLPALPPELQLRQTYRGFSTKSGFKCFYLISSRPVQGEKNIWTLQNESCMVRQPMCGLLHSWTYSFIYGLIEPAWNQFPAGHSIALAHAHALTDTWYIQM